MALVLLSFIWSCPFNNSVLDWRFPTQTLPECNNSVHCAGDYLHWRKDGAGNFIRGSTILVVFSKQGKV